MFTKSAYRKVGRWSALLAAYAFVLNALLATTLLAATPPSQSLSGFELCSSGAATAPQPDRDNKATKRAAIHCQICLQHAAPGALPPSSDLSLPLTLARSVAVAFVRNEAPDSEDGYSPHTPRGPPHLG